MEPGTLLADRYRLERAVGAGGMGQVWAARDELLGREVAIKVQAADGGTRADLERFRREAQAAAGLRHPNVVTIFDAGIDAGTAFLVMELLPGPDLGTYIAVRGVLPEPEAIALAEQVAAGLGAAHAAGVVHRDVKPANVMFHAPGSVKLVDFGIARLAQTAAARLTATNTLIGSAPYLAPEQVEGRPADERSDIYALGCVLMVMLTGRPPFEGEHPLAVMHQHASALAPRLRERRPELSPALDQLVAEMLDKAPQNRPATCRVVIERLRDIASGATAVLPGPTPATAVMPAVAAQAPEFPTPTRAMPQATRALPADTAVAGAAGAEPSRRGRGRAAVAAGVVVLLVAIIAAVALLGRQGGDGEAPLAAPASVTASAEPSPARTSPRASRQETPRATATSTPQPKAKGTPRATVQAFTPAPSKPDLQQALSDLNAAVDIAQGQGGLDKKKAEELDKRVKDLKEKLTEDGGTDAAKQVERTQSYVTDLSSKGDLDPAAAQQLQGALAEVSAAL